MRFGELGYDQLRPASVCQVSASCDSCGGFTEEDREQLVSAVVSRLAETQEVRVPGPVEPVEAAPILPLAVAAQGEIAWILYSVAVSVLSALPGWLVALWQCRRRDAAVPGHNAGRYKGPPRRGAGVLC